MVTVLVVVRCCVLVETCMALWLFVVRCSLRGVCVLLQVMCCPFLCLFVVCRWCVHFLCVCSVSRVLFVYVLFVVCG